VFAERRFRYSSGQARAQPALEHSRSGESGRAAPCFRAIVRSIMSSRTRSDASNREDDPQLSYAAEALVAGSVALIVCAGLSPPGPRSSISPALQRAHAR